MDMTPVDAEITAAAPPSGVACDFALPHPVQTRGMALARKLMRLRGWRVLYDGLPGPQGVFAVYPHTSNWDFPVGLFTKWGHGLPVKFWAKDSLFKTPLLGPWMRSVGGVAINRSAAHGVVGETVAQFEQARLSGELFWLVAAPEGTRKHMPGWKTGFYQTALRANVPVGLVKFDFGRKQVDIRDFIRLSGDMEADFARIRAVFQGVTACVPENAGPIEPMTSRAARRTGSE